MPRAAVLLAALAAVAVLLPAATSASSPTATGASASSLAASAHAAQRSAQEAAQLRHDDRGIYLAFCPPHGQIASTAAVRPRAVAAEANHEGWPHDECLKMDKGPGGEQHTLLGLAGVHNWLLGGYGNDTLYAGDQGDVMWGDYHPSGQSEGERDYIHGGAGEDWIYSSHGFNEIWTGAGNDHLALVYGHGVVYCNGGGVKTFVMRYLPQNRPWKLVGCSHKVLVRYRA
jgi:RTX calcium-binding nonapeptide repeat (4 copies)